jgi:hypothetical protein
MQMFRNTSIQRWCEEERERVYSGLAQQTNGIDVVLALKGLIIQNKASF